MYVLYTISLDTNNIQRFSSRIEYQSNILTCSCENAFALRLFMAILTTPTD